MLHLARIAPALIGLALAAPATAQAQSHAHTPGNCAYCNPSSGSTPIVQERRGPLARMTGGNRVVVPAGHHVQHPGQGVDGPVASWTDTSHALPAANAWYGAHDDEAGIAVVGPGYGPAPGMGYGGGTPDGGPMPIGEMRTSYVTPMPGAAGMAGPSMMPGAGPAAPGWRPDPAIQAWHQMKLGQSSVPRRPGAMSRMLGIASVNNWFEERRAMKAMRQSAQHGGYNPYLSEMPARAVTGQ